MRQLGAVEREAVSHEAQAKLASRLESAVAACDNAGLAAGITQALRLLTVQLRLLRRDATNFRLHILSKKLAGNAGFQYARDKFLTAWGIRQDMPLEEVRDIIFSVNDEFPRSSGATRLSRMHLCMQRNPTSMAVGQSG